MPNTRQGSIHLFRFAGVDLFLHWSWFLVAAYEIESHRRYYTSITWNILEYLALFSIVLMHEFGHALACRQVGGTADQILLWPFGGVAYVNPPQRPGAMLWSIAAGPLVNVALFPLLLAAVRVSRAQGWAQTMHDPYNFLRAVFYINLSLLVFNLLPIYPLDGGQILRSLLWFVFGRGRSLMIATILGFLGIAGFIGFALLIHYPWLIAISIYLLLVCWNGLRHAQVLLRQEKIPRREGFACPSCRMAPPVGARWKCGHCGQLFDTFETRAKCPGCGVQYDTTMCLHCREQHPMNEWVVNPYAGMGIVGGTVPTK
ncbi:MAG: site-2 protease family protein [Terracidiphilus sp.]|jgi:Zn-dependent protease